MTKRRRPVQLTPRSIERLLALGWTHAERVERDHHQRGMAWKTDLAGFADILAWGVGDVALVQVTTRENADARRVKIITSPQAFGWLHSTPGARIFVHGWFQAWGPGTAWDVDVTEITVGMFPTGWTWETEQALVPVGMARPVDALRGPMIARRT